MCGEPVQDGAAGRRIEERHHVARRDDHIEPLRDALRREVERGQISCQPDRARVIRFGCRDQVRVDVDADHVMSERGEPTADPSRSAAGVENPSSAPNHCVDEPRFTIEILTLCGHRPESFDIPPRMTGVLLDHPQPAVVAHAMTVPRRRPRSLTLS